MATGIDKKAFVRQDFLKRFVQAGGVNYNTAAKIYEAMASVFADAIVTGQKVSVGRVLSIKPIKRKARRVIMRFKGVSKTIHLSDRIIFKVNVHREFLNRHELNWKL